MCNQLDLTLLSCWLHRCGSTDAGAFHLDVHMMCTSRWNTPASVEAVELIWSHTVISYVKYSSAIW